MTAERVAPATARNRLWKPAVWVSVLIAALALGVAGAVLLNQPSPPRPAAPFDEIGQSGSVTDQGVTIEALGASYSGTETLLRLRLTVEDEAMVREGAGASGAVRSVVVSGPRYSGPFDGSAATSTMNGLGELMVHLPPLQPGDDYDGRYELRISELGVQFDLARATLPGDWTLQLAGPAPSDIADRLRIETFHASNLGIDGGEATITGLRSTSETQVSIALPDGRMTLTRPLLEVDGEGYAARSFNVEDGVATASFAATPFGKPVVVRLGAIAAATEGESTTFVLALDALREHAGDAETFPIPDGMILDGPAEYLVEGQQGAYMDRKWFGFVVKGNWHPENGEPIITDANGRELDLAHVGVGYEKDANGTVREGTTEIGFFVDGNRDLGHVTIVLGPSSQVDRNAYTVTLDVE